MFIYLIYVYIFNLFRIHYLFLFIIRSFKYIGKIKSRGRVFEIELNNSELCLTSTNYRYKKV